MTFDQNAAVGFRCLSKSESVQFACTFAAYMPELYHLPCCCRLAHQGQSCAGLRLFLSDHALVYE